MIPTIAGRGRTKHVAPAINPSEWVYIVSSALNSLPSPGTRVGTSDASNMPVIQASTSNSAIKTADGAAKYRLVGIQVKAPTTLLQSAVVKIGGSETTLAEFPADIIIDRCLVRGDATVGLRRGVELDGIRCAVVDSYIYDVKENGADSQAVWAYNTPGPIKVVNNYLEATGENMMTGGADAVYANSVPSDIEIRRNYFKKGSYASWAGTYSVKNLLEFKNAQRVLVEGNVLETCYPDSQTGFAFLCTVRNQDGGAPWSVTQDITFRYNKVHDTDSFMQCLGTDDHALPTITSQDTARVDVKHNLVLCNNSSATTLRMLQISSPSASVQFVHNTLLFPDGGGNSFGQSDGSPKMTGFVYKDNIVSSGAYGFRSDSAASGTDTLDAFYTGYDFTYNVRIGSGGTYPATNQVAADYAAVGFTDSANGDFSLSGSSSFKNDASDGADPGVAWSTLQSKIANAVDGQWGSEHATYATEATVNAELPRTYIDTTYANQSGTEWVCTTAAEFTTALAGCAVGDIITLTAGNTFTGSFTLRDI